VTPLIYEDLVIFAEYRGPLKAVRVHKSGDAWLTEPAWEHTDNTLIMSSPVMVEEHLIGFSSKRRGRYFSAEPRTGATRWNGEGAAGNNASLVALDNQWAALDDEGRLLFFAATEAGYGETARFQVADTPVWTHPLLWQDHILVKDAEHLTLWQLP
jgi:hypothetical protein